MGDISFYVTMALENMYNNEIQYFLFQRIHLCKCLEIDIWTVWDINGKLTQIFEMIESLFEETNPNE